MYYIKEKTEYIKSNDRQILYTGFKLTTVNFFKSSGHELFVFNHYIIQSLQKE